MKKKEIRKIENELSDIDVPDSVLNLARVEMSKADKVQKPTVHKFNFKIVLSCAASFMLCLAIILPITLSSFDKGGNGTPSDSSAGNDPPPDSSSSFNLSQLDKADDFSVTDGEQSSGSSEPQPPHDQDNGEKIKYLSCTIYSSSGTAIISEKTYSVYGAECTVYMLYDNSYKVDILEQFKNFTDEYSVKSLKINYKTNDESYLADTDYKNNRYCITGKFTEKSYFEEFCQYLFG